MNKPSTLAALAEKIRALSPEPIVACASYILNSNPYARGYQDGRDDAVLVAEQHAPAGDATSLTWGELPEQVRSVIEPHEWDNKTPSEQRDWAVHALSGSMVISDYWARKSAAGDDAGRLREAVERAVADERENCARTVEMLEAYATLTLVQRFADAIRSRGAALSGSEPAPSDAEAEKYTDHATTLQSLAFEYADASVALDGAHYRLGRAKHQVTPNPQEVAAYSLEVDRAQSRMAAALEAYRSHVGARASNESPLPLAGAALSGLTPASRPGHLGEAALYLGATPAAEAEEAPRG